MSEKPLTDAELSALKSARNKKEWNQVCDAVKAARDGAYSSDWYARVILSGVAAERVSAWKGGA